MGNGWRPRRSSNNPWRRSIKLHGLFPSTSWSSRWIFRVQAQESRLLSNIEKAFLSLGETATWQNLITFPHSGGMLKVGRAELFFPKAETQGWSSKRSTKLSLIHLTTLAQCISNTWRKPRRHFWPKSMAYTRYKFIFLVVSLSVIGS